MVTLFTFLASSFFSSAAAAGAPPADGAEPPPRVTKFGDSVTRFYLIWSQKSLNLVTLHTSTATHGHISQTGHALLDDLLEFLALEFADNLK